MLPGQFVTVRSTPARSKCFAVPQTAVLQGNQGRFVWIVGADGKAAQRPVEVGEWVGQDWIIRNGLKAGDRVIVDNLMKLRPGVAVSRKRSRRMRKWVRRGEQLTCSRSSSSTGRCSPA